MQSVSWESRVACLEMREQAEAAAKSLEYAGAGQTGCETLEKVVAAAELPPAEAIEKTSVTVQATQEGEEDSQDRVKVHAPEDYFDDL